MDRDTAYREAQQHLAAAERAAEEGRGAACDRHLAQFNRYIDIVEEERMGRDDDYTPLAERTQLGFDQPRTVSGSAADGLPSFGGDGRMLGYDQHGQEVRSFQAGDSIYRFEASRRGWDRSFWDEPEYPVGKTLRALAVGPRDAWERRALGSTNADGAIPDPIRARIADNLKAVSVLGMAGAQFVNMESASLVVTRVASPASFSWTAEGSTSSSSDPSFESETLNAKTLRGVHRVNRELAMDAPDFPQVLEREFGAELRTELQRAAFHGSTSNGAPKGLYNSTGDGVVKLNFGGSTDGATVSSSGAAWGEILRAREQLLTSNVPDGRQSYVMHPRTDRQYSALTDANHQPVQPPSALRPVGRFVTTSVSKTLAPSTGLSGQSAIFYGRFPHLLVGMRVDPMIEITNALRQANFQLSMLSFLRADIVPERPSAFVILDRVSS